MASSGSDHFQRVMEGFLRVVDAPESQRAQRLEEVSAGDPSVRAQIQAMLHADATPTGVGAEVGPRLDHLGAGAELLAEAIHVDDARQATEKPRVLSDRYRIVGVLGEGGMGVVYEAMQTYPPRKVALKALRPGLQSRSLLRRFAHEAAVLARLQHPGIAQVYDAGASDPTSPDQAFIVMEFVDGKPILEHAREHALDLHDRVRLMAMVCDAVQHAHQRGVIHRDLKPSNVMVNTAGQPKILDFGVARLVSDEPAMTTMHTIEGQMVGTLGYMSPEQVDGLADHIDATTDVYALGVMLYELLADRPAFALHGKPMAEAARLVKILTPAPLSSVAHGCRGDLETIVATAMHREQARRYQTASAFASDLRRFLGGEAIEARRDSSLYLLQKSLVRYRWAVRAGIAAVIGLSAFGVYSARQAVKERELASREAAARLEATAALDIAERRRQMVDELSRRLREELVASKLERARLEAELGKGASAEALVWNELLEDPQAQEAWWALREHYGRFPCVWETGSVDNATCVAADPTDHLIAVGSNKGQLAILRASDGGLVASATVEDDESVHALAWSDDGATLVAAGFSGTLASFSVPASLRESVPGGASAEPVVLSSVRAEPALVGYPMTMATHSGTSTLVVGGGIGLFRVVDLKTLEFRSDWTGPQGIVSAMALDGAGRVAIATREGKLSVRYVADGSVAWEVDRVADAPAAVAFAPDGHSVLVGTRDRSVLRCADTDPRITTLVTGLGGLVRACAPSPDGASFLTAAGPTIQLATPGQNRAMRVIGYHAGGVQGAIWAKDGSIISLSFDGTIKRWLTRRWPMIHAAHTAGTWQSDLEVVRLASAGDTRTLLVSGDMTGLMIAIDAATGTCAWRHQFEAARVGREVGVYRVRASTVARRDGVSTIFVGLNDGTIRMLNAADGTEIGAFEVGALEVSDIVTSPDSSRLACLDGTRTISLWDLSDLTRPVPAQREVKEAPGSIVDVNPDVSGERPTKFEPLRVGVPTATDFDRSMAFSIDGRVLYVGLDKGVQLLDGQTLEPLEAIKSDAAVRSVTSDPHGLVVFGEHDGHVVLLDRASSSSVPRSGQSGHVSVTATAINADATLIVSGGDDGSISVWSRAEVRQLCTIPLGMGEVCAVAFIDDQDRIGVATRQGIAIVNPYEMDRAILASLERALQGLTNETDATRDEVRAAARSLLRP